VTVRSSVRPSVRPSHISYPDTVSKRCKLGSQHFCCGCHKDSKFCDKISCCCVIGFSRNVCVSDGTSQKYVIFHLLVLLFWRVMQFLIQSSKLSLTTSRAKLGHWALELKTTCRTSALRRRMFYLQPFPQFHLGFSNALTVTSVYAVTIKQLLTQKCSNANSLSFAQSFHTI